MSAAVVAICRRASVNICYVRGAITAADAQTLIATVATSSRVVMILSEYLRYVLAGDWPD